ncbi:MAG: hypothetical protein NTZ05_14165 [Chloroflexi bacterium]|nr:hypothetical protein [Chloroflexota bacterium]
MNETFENYVVRLYPQGDGSTVIELRLRVGHWPAILVALPIEEKDFLPPEPFRFGPARHFPEGLPSLPADEAGELNDGLYWYLIIGAEVSPDQSCYLTLAEPPSELLFGAPDSEEMFRYRPRRRSLGS